MAKKEHKEGSTFRPFEGIGVMLKQKVGKVVAPINPEKVAKKPKPVEDVPKDVKHKHDLKMFGREVEMIVSGKIDEAIKSLTGRLVDDPTNLQVRTAKDILSNCIREGVQPGVKSFLQVQAKNLLLNTDSTEASNTLDEIINYRDFEGINLKPQPNNIALHFGEAERLLEEYELKEVFIILHDLINNKDLNKQAQQNLLRAYNMVKAQGIDDQDEDSVPLSESERKAFASDVKDIITEAFTHSLSFEEAEEKKLVDLSSIEVKLPIDVKKATIIDSIPLVIDIKGEVSRKAEKAHKMVRIVNSVYLIRARVIGVPSINDLSAEYERARKHIWKKERANLLNIALRRPDTDATWFPILNIEAVIGSVGFPDRVRKFQGGAISVEEQSQRSLLAAIQIRARREAFEAENIDMITEQALCAKTASDARQLAGELGSKLKDVFNMTEPPEALIRNHYATEMEKDLRGLTDMVYRWKIRQRANAKADEMVELLHAKLAAQSDARINTRRSNELLGLIANAKMEQLQPQLAANQKKLEMLGGGRKAA